MDQLVAASRQSSHVAFQHKALSTWNNLLKALSDELEPSEADKTKRGEILQTVSNLLLSLGVDGPVRASPYGSFLSTMYSPDSDLDIALVGSCREFQGAPAAELHALSARFQDWLLGRVADMLEGNRLVLGRVQRILGARVPVLNFRHFSTNVECDITVARRETFLKPRFLNVLTEIDERFSQLYRLIKMWAGAHGLNDASCSTLNSWSLCMLVIFYLQQQQPAVLPPLWSLLYSSEPADGSPRVLQLADVDTDSFIEQAKLGARLYLQRRDGEGGTGRNGDSLMELLAGFFSFYAAPFQAWSNGQHRDCRVCPWFGTWRSAKWQRPYLFGVEDPFDDTDNAARAVGTASHSGGTSAYIAYAFSQSLEVVRAFVARGGPGPDSTDSLRRGFAWLFGPSGILRLPEQVAAQLGFDSELLKNVTEWLSPPRNKAGQLMRVDPMEVKRRHVFAFRRLLKHLEAPCDMLCVEDFHAARRAEKKVQQAEAERAREAKAALRKAAGQEARVAKLAAQASNLSLAAPADAPSSGSHAAIDASSNGAPADGSATAAAALAARAAAATATALTVPVQAAPGAQAIAAAAVRDALRNNNSGSTSSSTRQASAPQQQGQRLAFRFVPVYAPGQGPPGMAAAPQAKQQQQQQQQAPQLERQQSGHAQPAVHQHQQAVPQFLLQQQAATAAAQAAYHLHGQQQQQQQQRQSLANGNVTWAVQPEPAKVAAGLGSGFVAVSNGSAARTGSMAQQQQQHQAPSQAVAFGASSQDAATTDKSKHRSKGDRQQQEVHGGGSGQASASAQVAAARGASGFSSASDAASSRAAAANGPSSSGSGVTTVRYVYMPVKGGFKRVLVRDEDTSSASAASAAATAAVAGGAGGSMAASSQAASAMAGLRRASSGAGSEGSGAQDGLVAGTAGDSAGGGRSKSRDGHRRQQRQQQRAKGRQAAGSQGAGAGAAPLAAIPV